MSILRVLTLGGLIGLSTAVVCFVAADRVTHTTLPAPATVAMAPAVEPETTGALVQEAVPAETAPAKTMGGFDTERLNALMRGEMPPPPPVPARTAVRKR